MVTVFFHFASVPLRFSGRRNRTDSLVNAQIRLVWSFLPRGVRRSTLPPSWWHIPVLIPFQVFSISSRGGSGSHRVF